MPTPSASGREFSVSDVCIRLVKPPFRLREAVADGDAIKLCLIGSLAQRYKGADVAIDAVADCVARGVNLELTIIGDGKCRPKLERQAAKLGLSRRVIFRGNIPAGEPVVAALDESDLFVMASRTEGLPRALIEAMARGLPCIGTGVGGIPELLQPEDLVPPNDAAALGRKLREVIADRRRMQEMSARNHERAKAFDEGTFMPGGPRFTDSFAIPPSSGFTMAVN